MMISMNEISYLDPGHVSHQPLSGQHEESNTSSNTGSIPHTYNKIIDQLTTTQWHKMVLSLNKEQYGLHSRPVGWGGSVGSDEPPPPPTEAIKFHLAWLKQGSKVCKDNKPYAAICFK